MDENTIAQLASSVIAILLPFMKTFAEKFTEEAGKQSVNSIKSLYKVIKKKFSSKKSAKEAFSDFEKDPLDSDLQTVFRVQLKKFLTNDKEFAETIARFVRDESKSHNQTNIVNGSGAMAIQGGIAAGEGGVAIDGNVNGDINIKN